LGIDPIPDDVMMQIKRKEQEAMGMDPMMPPEIPQGMSYDDFMSLPQE
jgi:hypothetical protein